MHNKTILACTRWNVFRRCPEQSFVIILGSLLKSKNLKLLIMNTKSWTVKIVGAGFFLTDPEVSAKPAGALRSIKDILTRSLNLISLFKLRVQKGNCKMILRLNRSFVMDDHFHMWSMMGFTIIEFSENVSLGSKVLFPWSFGICGEQNVRH